MVISCVLQKICNSNPSTMKNYIIGAVTGVRVQSHVDQLYPRFVLRYISKVNGAMDHGRR